MTLANKGAKSPRFVSEVTTVTVVSRPDALVDQGIKAPASKAAFKAQFQLYSQTEEERQEAKRRIEEARVNDDGLHGGSAI